jgi:hypothetical protein
MIPSYVKVVAQRFSLLLAAYFICRVFFLLWNLTLYSQAPAEQIAEAFLRGLRFDLAAIVFTNALLIPLWLLPSFCWLWPWVRKLELGLFGVLNGLALGFNVVDAEFVKFIGKRTSYDLLLMTDDLQRHSANVILTYWQLCLGWLLLSFGVFWFARRFQPGQENWRAPQFWIWRALLIGLVVMAGRGGFQFKPLHPMHAYFSTRHEIGLLTLNTPFNLIKSRPRGEVRRERYFATDAEAIRHLAPITELSRPPLAVSKDWNVVVILLESFNLEYMGASNDYPGYSPFLDSLTKKSFFFPLNFANARRSIEGLPAVLCAMPAIMAEPIITSDFSNNRFDCLPKILAAKGYSTYFLHGAHNGSMHFDTFSRIAGFENFVGLNEYPKNNKEDLDEYWGVLDEPMLQYAVKTIDEAKPPVMLSLFTLSSHHPYYIPPKYHGKFPKGTLEIHESIGYTDYALQKFFETAATRPWFNKTIFVITADHTQKSDQPKYANLIGPWRVPLFIYVPGLKAGQVKTSAERITQHIDIVPSVLDLLGVNWPERPLLGQSVFDLAKPGRAYNYTYYSYWQINPEVLIDFGRDSHPLKAFKHKGTYNAEETEARGEAVDRAVLDLKSTVHYLNEGLQKNSLHLWRESK